MKNKIIILIAIAGILQLLFVACDEEKSNPPINTVGQDMVLTIADIYKIQADSGDYVFKNDYMLYATVTLNDDEGNIYKEAYVQDSTGGINLYKLSHKKVFDIGDKVRINLRDAEVKLFKGKMEIVFKNVLNFKRQMVVQEHNVPIEPENVTIPDILNGDYTCKLVKLQDVQFADEELNSTYCVELPTGQGQEVQFEQNKTLVDCAGNSIIVRTSNFASFAKDTVAQGKGSIIAIATLYKGFTADVWQLTIRSVDEIDMNGDRCE